MVASKYWRCEVALKSFRVRLEEAKQSDSFWFERAKNDFAVAIGKLLQRRSMTKNELALALDIAPAQVSKTLRGDSNVTIETMVKFARAAGGRLELRVVDTSSTARWADVIEISAARRKAYPFRYGVAQISSAPSNSEVSATVGCDGVAA